ncbi:fumarylacetoacetate hydrolase family protein [Aliiglaciecola sp. LCG003]|uniref:fumarylacetoacetate hydrolase family protein n=1 Tax=Aliiglaciecola sp. LCG003 TaxID=3053655 RepID=UPI0025725C3D|nr:fumarylacetoacetate hydrolase family protein [Aliiglaciecola sp. LCG003]WJG08202.1 fumarylacetoacetate hydrolase family protein [Aliiglaciecola sp. LCG003]
MYNHRGFDGEILPFPPGKVVCVGRNYVDHVHELNSEMPTQPLLFMKPASSLRHVSEPVNIPADRGSCHNELEIALLIGKTLSSQTSIPVRSAIWGVGLGLDLTLRDVQTELKAKGLPWERAKSFDGACPVSDFVPIQQIDNLDTLTFNLKVNQQIRQLGDAALMIWNIDSLLMQISQVFTLSPGDIVLTGTPKGVGPLSDGDEVSMTLDGHFSLHTRVFSNKDGE